MPDNIGHSVDIELHIRLDCGCLLRKFHGIAVAWSFISRFRNPALDSVILRSNDMTDHDCSSLKFGRCAAWERCFKYEASIAMSILV